MSRINYPLKVIRGVAFDVDGVLSPTLVPMNENGIPQRMANLKDGYAINLAVKAGLHIVIISGADTPGVRARMENLGITDLYMGRLDKLDCLREWMSNHGLTLEEVAYCGDDIPDLMPMKACGLSVAPRDAAPEIKSIAKHITSCDGGKGVARELLEEILKVRGQWPGTSMAFGQ